MNRSKFMRFGMCNHKLRKGKYTLYLKFKKRDIPNTHISAEIYRIPDLKSPCIPYTQKPWPTLTSGVPLLSKFGNLSMREIFVVTSVHARPPVQTLEEGETCPKATRRKQENAFFSWREIAQCFWATSVFLGGKSHDHLRSWQTDCSTVLKF